jgi:hypothetical protein
MRYYTDISLERLRNIMKTSANNAYIQLLNPVTSSLKAAMLI